MSSANQQRENGATSTKAHSQLTVRATNSPPLNFLFSTQAASGKSENPTQVEQQRLSLTHGVADPIKLAFTQRRDHLRAQHSPARAPTFEHDDVFESASVEELSEREPIVLRDLVIAVKRRRLLGRKHALIGDSKENVESARANAKA